jgi:uncharacterized protein (TIGR02453 family)
MADFEGFPVAALDFYDDLELDNTKSFWTEHKHVYDESVAAPMKALCEALEPEFGKAKLFRPYRDVRFAKDKTPYKTHQGAYVSIAPSTGYYVQVSAGGIRTGGGHYDADAATLGRIRNAIVDDRLGQELEDIVESLTADGFEVGGEKLKTSPRGYDADHPRIELLRHKSMTLGKSYGFAPVIHTAELLDLVRADWREATPFVQWVADQAGGD